MRRHAVARLRLYAQLTSERGDARLYVRESHAHVFDIGKIEALAVVDYRDNGKGFNLEEVESVGMGLSNIKSRISSLGGKIRFDSKPGNGMLAHIEVSTTGEIVQLAEDLYEQVYGKRYGRKKS